MRSVGIFIYDISLFGGAERVGINIANALSKYTNVTLISCFNSKKTPAFDIADNVDIEVISNETKSLTLHCVGLSSTLKGMLKKRNIDVLINITAGINTISFLATKNNKVKAIYAEHSNLLNKSYGKKHELRQWLGAKTADYVVTLTESDKQQFIEKYKIRGKCTSIYNWFDGLINDEYDADSKKIITVGRLEAVKGYDRLIKIASCFFKEFNDWSWDIYGDGSLKDNIQSLINNSGLGNNICLKGNVTNILELYKNYSFFVMTSYYEGLPMVLLEAKSNMLPIISFDCPTGPREIITNDFDGYLVENGNIDQMVDRMLELAKNREKRIKFSKNAAEVLSKFDKELILSKWRNLIESV